MNDVLVNKAQSIQRCVQRAREIYAGKSAAFLEDFDAQDAAVLNILRACELSIDAANYLIKREIVRVKNEASREFEKVWIGDFVFENEWHSFRTKKDRGLELMTPFHECAPKQYKIAVKVMDIFGNDTMKIKEVGV